NQEVNMHAYPQEPRQHAPAAEGWHIGDRERAPNDRQAPLIPVAEWRRRWRAHNPATNDRRHILACLDRWLRHAWQRDRFLTPDAGPGSCRWRRKGWRGGGPTAAVSPMAKILGWPGTERSGCPFPRPALSVSTPSHCPAGEATTPAVHTTVRLPIRWPATTTPLALTSSTLVLVRTCTPRCSK